MISCAVYGSPCCARPAYLLQDKTHQFSQLFYFVDSCSLFFVDEVMGEIQFTLHKSSEIVLIWTPAQSSAHHKHHESLLKLQPI